MRYFITFVCYGARLHGHEAGSMDRHHNLFGGRVVEPNARRVDWERRSMGAPFSLDSDGRSAVLNAVQEVCLYRGWRLLAAHVRTSHVHVIVDGEIAPEKMMNDFKAYASRALNELGRDEPGRKRWARHGSTRWLWKDQDVREAIGYVVDGQGEPMAVFLADAP